MSHRLILILLATALVASACGDSEQTSTAIATSTSLELSESVDLVESTTSAVAVIEVDDSTTTQDTADVTKYPTIIAAALTPNSDGTWSLAVTLSSTYDTPARYADGWRVNDEQGNVIGDRPLAHDHQGEQPFTRSTSGIVIPEGTTILTIEARDQQYGWSPDTFTVEVPQR